MAFYKKKKQEYCRNSRYTISMNSKLEHKQATLGGGCFWCMEAVFQRLAGVEEVVSGYMGGHVEDPAYEQVCTGATGHAEVIQITFNPGEISYDELLEVFWKTHDPTTPNRQGNDFGPQYRSVIFYHDEEQQHFAEEHKNRLNSEHVWDKPIVTEIVPATTFWPAEEHHQEYYNNHSSQTYCRVIIAPKIAKLKKAFTGKLEP
jgi:peptide-methionine (S)-S-oxide reductase